MVEACRVTFHGAQVVVAGGRIQLAVLGCMHWKPEGEEHMDWRAE